MNAAPSSARCFALVPCAGVGERAGLGAPKQYAPIAGRALIAHTLDALMQVPRLQVTLVVLAAGDAQFATHCPATDDRRVWVAHCGGATRAASVANGLAELQRRGASDDDWVLVHDAARCLLQPAWVERLIDACIADDVGGLLALPLSDTLKHADGERSRGTLPRTDKWAAQTPQMFRIGLLRRALAQAGGAVTDEASAVEALGLRPRLVMGEMENFKITWPQDLRLAQRLLRTRDAGALA